MKIGITGHQKRDGIDWSWVRSRIKQSIAGDPKIIGYSSLAAGTDQVFAETVLDEGGQIKAIIPIESYASYFEDEALERYKRLLPLSDVIELRSSKRDEWAFLDAGKWIVRKVNRMIAVWDGEEAEGTGGTGDIVSYAILMSKPVVHLNPISREVTNL